MDSINATEARRQMHRLEKLAADGPIVVLRSCEPVAIVMVPEKYHKLLADAVQAVREKAGMVLETET